MSQGKSLIRWTSLTTLALLAIGPAYCADTPPPGSAAPPSAPADDGHTYKTVQVMNGGKPLSIRVRQEPDPLQHASLKDELDSHRAFSETNEMSHKSFISSNGAGWNKSADLKAQDAFAAKPYSFNEAAPTAPNLGTKATFRSASFQGSTPATGFNRAYPTNLADASQNQAAVLGARKSDDQDRTAQLNGQPVDLYTSSLSGKTFQGTEATAIHQHLTQLGNGQIQVSDLPNRPLSIDEVRDLINHGFKPNTSEPPPPASKPLNDPDYVPQPLRDDPSPASATPSAKASDDDKDDAVPPPGTMATPPPENSEPLPRP